MVLVALEIFAEMLTANMNTNGTPCTLKYVDGERVKACDFDSKRLQFDKEIQEDMNGIELMSYIEFLDGDK